MKKFRIIYILIFVLFSLQSNSQTADFTIDSLRISSLSVRLVADYSDSTDTYSFEWNFGDGTTNTESIVEHTYAQAGTFTIRLTTRLVSDGSLVDVVSENVTLQDAFIIPNVFSPNNDGLNDFFIVYSNGLRNIKIQIFSRTGVLVYKTTAPAIAWDGRNLSGVEVGPGVYYYIVTTDDGMYERTGFLQLFK